MAAELKISLRHYQKLESNTADIKRSTYEKIAKILNLPTCFLLNEEVTPDQRALNINCSNQLLNLLPVGIQINDNNGLIIYSNKKYNELYQFSSEDLKRGKYIWDSMTDPEEPEKLKAYFKFLVEDRPQPTPYFTRNTLKDGTVVPLRIDWTYLEDISTGKLIGFLCVVSPFPA